MTDDEAAKELRAEIVRLASLSRALKEWADKLQAQRDEALDQRDEAMALAERFKVTNASGHERIAAHYGWEAGYAQGYADREKTDHDRADVIKSLNPYPFAKEKSQ